ncbi:GNAT family protein [Pontixanthobacter gangjinensis]|uniref:GNAT family N-acetyltransferase n=1 Tax=Pontixanthobacter gangjinensis TaxID=1028742 RepID=UPI002E26EB58
MTNLSAILEGGPVRLEPLAQHHLEPLRAACAEDPEIWEIYPVNMLGDDFDAAMERFHAMDNWVKFAVIDAATGQLVGMTNYISPDAFGVVEIGGTYIAPMARRTGFNRAMKKLLIEHAFANGFRKIRFNIDTRNTRSMAAVAKLGALREGTLRQDRITWTGYIRDTAVFGLLREEWAG